MNLCSHPLGAGLLSDDFFSSIECIGGVVEGSSVDGVDVKVVFSASPMIFPLS